MMKTFLCTLAALAAFAGAATAGPGQTKTSTAAICPVTGTKIASPAKAYNKEVYKGKTYYFCCPECKPRFDKNPQKFIKNAAKGKYEKM